jgi:hypothetical protein
LTFGDSARHHSVNIYRNLREKVTNEEKHKMSFFKLFFISKRDVMKFRKTLAMNS